MKWHLIMYLDCLTKCRNENLEMKCENMSKILTKDEIDKIDELAKKIKDGTIKYEGIGFFWKYLIKMDMRIVTNQEELEIFKKNKIKEFDKDRWFTYKNYLFYFLNIRNNFLIAPSYFDLNLYDLMFSKIIDNNAYYILKNEIFNIYDKQIHDKNKKNKLDYLIDRIKKGEYGKIDESNFSFIDIFLYMESTNFYLRDEKAIQLEKAKNIEYDDNYGGRCLSLLSIKKILIDNIHIYESTLEHEKKRLGIENIKPIMKINKIPRNERLSKKTRQKDVEDSWKN